MGDVPSLENVDGAYLELMKAYFLCVMEINEIRIFFRIPIVGPIVSG